MHITLTNKQKTKVVANLLRVSNLPLVWTVSDDSIVALEVSGGDNLSAELTALKEGDATVSVRANCDLGSGWRQVDGTFDVHVVAKQPDIAFFSAVPVEQPEPAKTYWKPDDE